MANIELDDFRRRIEEESITNLIDDCLADDDPWLFRSAAGGYVQLQNLVKEQLQDPALSCVVVGSAKFGYSISPDSFGRQFRQASDIDVAIISPRLFDDVWAALLQWRYPWHTRTWQDRARQWAVEHMEQHIAGSVAPERIKVEILGAVRIPPPIQPISNRWFDTFKRAANIQPMLGHDVEGRLYRTQAHLKHYIEYGLKKVQENLRNLK